MAQPEEIPVNVVEEIQSVLRDVAPERAQELDTILPQLGVRVAATVLALHPELANRRQEYDRDREHPTFRDMAEYLMAVYENVRR
jgi:hypothetical protein